MDDGALKRKSDRQQAHCVSTLSSVRFGIPSFRDLVESRISITPFDRAWCESHVEILGKDGLMVFDHPILVHASKWPSPHES